MGEEEMVQTGAKEEALYQVLLAIQALLQRIENISGSLHSGPCESAVTAELMQDVVAKLDEFVPHNVPCC